MTEHTDTTNPYAAEALNAYADAVEFDRFATSVIDRMTTHQAATFGDLIETLRRDREDETR